MTVKVVGGTDPQLIYAADAYGGPGRPFYLINLDTASPVYYDSSLAISPTSNIIYPLGNAGFDGAEDVYASTLTPGLSVHVLSLAGQTGWDAGPVQTAAAIQQMGAPPQVPNATTYSLTLVDQTGSPYTLHTFTGPSRLWGVHLSFALYKDSSATSPAQAYAKVYLDSGLVLMPCEGVLSGPNTLNSDIGDLTFPGIAVAAGDKLRLDVNNGNGISNGGLRASCIVLASTP